MSTWSGMWLRWQKLVQLPVPVENVTPLPEITSILEGVDEFVPSKEYRTWIAGLDMVMNALSYQYFLSYLFMLIAARRFEGSHALHQGVVVHHPGVACFIFHIVGKSASSKLCNMSS